MDFATSRDRAIADLSPDLRDAVAACRQKSVDLCRPLATEDYVVQPVAEVSPPKWHLAHTTWFFEEMILAEFCPGYRRFDDRYGRLFNSYYKGLGTHWLQSERGALSRPTVEEILSYRAHVDERVAELLNSPDLPDRARFVAELGIHHEQQHQELLLMDIKYILAVNPFEVRYASAMLPASTAPRAGWTEYDSGLRSVGYAGDDFSFDNEAPRHSEYLPPFALARSLVSNGEYREFIEAGGYRHPEHWLSLGWDWVQKSGAGNPLYWRRDESSQSWSEFTLHGTRALDPHAPVAHLNYFEASAFAKWRGARLPTEAELEVDFFAAAPAASTPPNYFHPTDANVTQGQLWCWTRSAYSPYPGFREFAGALQEYNGKFMCNQLVLRGGCVATPAGHYRPTYRNFFLPEQRWMFSGLRLAKDLENPNLHGATIL